MQPAEGAAMGVDPIRPARFWYWVAGAAAAVAVVWLVLGLVLGLLWVTRQVEAFQRVPIPGAVQVSFDEPGGYTIYYEWEGVGAAEHVPLPSFNATLTSVSTGEQVSIRDYGAPTTYEFAGRSGLALGTFRIQEPGRFLLQTEGESHGGQANAAVGPGIGRLLFRGVIPSLAGGLILLLAGGIVALVVAVRRNRARRLLPAPAAQPVARWGQGTAPAGWLADPGRRHELRYWDGQQWTEHVSDRGTQGVDPL